MSTTLVIDSERIVGDAQEARWLAGTVAAHLAWVGVAQDAGDTLPQEYSDANRRAQVAMNRIYRMMGDIIANAHK